VGTNMTGVNVYSVLVNKGEPIDVPEKPWEGYYVEDWGFIGGRTDGWTLTPGEWTGNVTISGNTPATDWAAVRGGFYEPVKPAVGKALAVTGQIELVGGGFEDLNSLRYGIFYSDSAGVIDSTEVGYVWTGSEDHHNGYLFLPPSGTNLIATWQATGETGSFGAVVNGSWLSTDGANSYALGNKPQSPATAVGRAGTYNFGLYIVPQADGTRHVRFSLVKIDNSYSFIGSGIDNHTPLASDKFNCVAFALNSSSATAMNLADVYVDLLEIEELPTAVKESVFESLPMKYVLSQNYPNPFNPTTTIEFALPQAGKVKLVVYDVTGRVVANLASGTLDAGYHRILFNATNLATGVYFYKLEAGDKIEVKKLALVK